MSSSLVRPLHVIDAGEGSPLFLLHGYGIRPRSYVPLAQMLTPRCRVLIPDLLALSLRWSPQAARDALLATIDDMGFERVTIVAHSFGGGTALRFAACYPDRVEELVFADTLGLAHEWRLAREAVRPMTIVHLTSRIALRDFTYSWAHHPFQMARAAWSGFVGERDEAIARIAATTVPRHVLWAERDTLLPRTDGRRFARALHASFTIGHSDGSRTIDHDWMYREPKVFAEHLFDLRLHALHTGGAR